VADPPLPFSLLSPPPPHTVKLPSIPIAMPAQKRSFPDSPHDHHRHTKHHHQEKIEEEEAQQQEEDNYESNGSGFFYIPLPSL